MCQPNVLLPSRPISNGTNHHLCKKTKRIRSCHTRSSTDCDGALNISISRYASPSRGCPIRLRFLRRIGVGEEKACLDPARQPFWPAPSSSRGRTPVSSLAMRVPLKATVEEELPWSSTSAELGQRRRVRFAPTVVVRSIPRRDEYSDRIRQMLWTDPREMCANVARNTMEFTAEGWNWRNCIEEDRMYMCENTGKLLHPAFVLMHVNRMQQYHQNLWNPFLQKSRAAAHRWS